MFNVLKVKLTISELGRNYLTWFLKYVCPVHEMENFSFGNICFQQKVKILNRVYPITLQKEDKINAFKKIKLIISKIENKILNYKLLI